MAVVSRKRKSGVTYYVVNEQNRRQVWERVGPNKREAEIRDRAMKQEIADGTYHPKEGARAVLVGEYAKVWSTPRTNAYAKDERRMLRLYVYPRDWLCSKRLEEVRPADSARLVRELRAERKPDGERRLSDKTIANVLGVLKLIFDAAVLADLCLRNPVKLAPKTLERAPATERETYTAAEVNVLCRHHSIPWPIRVLNALSLLAGLREGEACGRRWRDLDPATSPLPAMAVRDQYDGQPLKTKRPRIVPVHTELVQILDHWAREGFELYVGRAPSPQDFIVPNVSSRARARNHTRSSYYKAFVRYAEAAGVRPRALHATRHTFITLCRRGGARADVLERVTHNAKGTIIDRYTHFDWAPLCEAVSSLRIDVHPDLHPVIGSAGNSGGDSAALDGNLPQLSAGSAQSRGVQFPAPPLRHSGKTAAARGPRQPARQEFDRLAEELSAANRRRRRRLLSLQEADPAAAAPGLAFCKGLEAAYRGDERATVEALAEAAQALGLTAGGRHG